MFAITVWFGVDFKSIHGHRTEVCSSLSPRVNLMPRSVTDNKRFQPRDFPSYEKESVIRELEIFLKVQSVGK